MCQGILSGLRIMHRKNERIIMPQIHYRSCFQGLWLPLQKKMEAAQENKLQARMVLTSV